MMQQMTNPNDPQINPREILTLYLNQQYDLLSETLIKVLEHFDNITYYQLDNNAHYFVNAFVKNFLYVFTQPDYILSDGHGVRFIQLNAAIANVVSMSGFKNTNAYLEILKNQPNNFLKLLALYSARSTYPLDRKEIFDTHGEYACMWYSHYYDLYFGGFVTKEVYHNFREHLYYGISEPRLTDFYNISNVYFGATYVDGDRDRELKQKINLSMRERSFIKNVKINNQPNPKKIAIVSGLWFRQHSVYRTLYKFVESLKDDYELTLINLAGDREDIDVGIFKNVIQLDLKDAIDNNLSILQNNNFMAAYFPDIGMVDTSIVLANLRFAPIQAFGSGHPVSTFGSEMDYYISGADVEIKQGAENNYSERLVLLPGLGSINNYPLYELSNRKKNRPEFIINCSWTCYKFNYPLLLALKRVIIKASKPVVFRFFPGGAESRKNTCIPFAEDLASVLGQGSFEVIPAQPYQEYMAIMEEGDICIEAYHFGGSNTVVDFLYLGKPTVTFEGNKWYNRIGSQLLRLVGLSELIATNEEEYVNLMLKLIDDDTYRASVAEKIKKVDLKSTILNSESQKYFKKAIDFLIDNHEQLKQDTSRKPILIK